MTGSSRSSSAFGLSCKRCGCGDEVVVFTAGSRAKNPGKMFRRCPNWKDVNRSCGLFEWVEDDDSTVAFRLYSLRVCASCEPRRALPVHTPSSEFKVRLATVAPLPLHAADDELN
ncbi:Zinc finger, GRF-type [Sesbania bispinosa]|nr:Zinc finger, GRF-type [Sesbania bispinosa]